MSPEVEEALDKRASIGLLGNMQQYTQYQAANAIEASANNPSGGNQALELGMGMALGQQMTNMMQPPASQTPPPPPPPPQTQWYIAQKRSTIRPF